jgi:hypothetical protein
MGFFQEIQFLVRLASPTAFAHVLIIFELLLFIPEMGGTVNAYILFDFVPHTGLFCDTGVLHIPRVVEILSALPVQDYTNSCFVWPWDPTVLHMPLPSGLNLTVVPADYYRLSGYPDFRMALEERLTYQVLTTHDCFDILDDLWSDSAETGSDDEDMWTDDDSDSQVSL